MRPNFECAADRSLILLLTEINVCNIPNLSVGWHKDEISNVLHSRPSLKSRSFPYQYLIFKHLWLLSQTLLPTMILLSHYFLTLEKIAFLETEHFVNTSCFETSLFKILKFNRTFNGLSQHNNILLYFTVMASYFGHWPSSVRLYKTENKVTCSGDNVNVICYAIRLANVLKYIKTTWVGTSFCQWIIGFFTKDF